MISDSPNDGREIVLTGLDGSNPLAFLAALGTLRLVQDLPTVKQPSRVPRMLWRPFGGALRPVLQDVVAGTDELLDRLHNGLKTADSEPWELDRRLPFAATKLRKACLGAVKSARVDQRGVTDTLAAFGVEAVVDKKGLFEDTALRMVRSGDSAGNGLTAYAQRILKEVSVEDLRRTLLEPWRLEDENAALRWAPEENRSYALQWTDPSKEKTVAMRGANALALAAMPLLPTVPVTEGLAGFARVRTVGFGRPMGRTESLTWPIWSYRASLEVVRSLLVMPELQRHQPDAGHLLRCGVEAVYRSDRILTSTYYRNFAPARRIA